VAIAVITAPITVLAGTFGGLAAGVVALAAVTGHIAAPLAALEAHARAAADTLGARAAPMAEKLLEVADKLIPVVEQLGMRLEDWFAERIMRLLPIAGQIAGKVLDAVLGLAAGWGNLVDWFMDHWPAYTAAIQGIWDNIGTGVHFVLPLLGLAQAAFGALGPVVQFIRDHADSLRPVLLAVGGLLVVMAGSAVLAAGSVLLVVAALVAVAAALSTAVTWLRDHIPGAIAAAGGAFSALGTWVRGIVDDFWGIVNAAEAAAGAISRAAAAARNIPVIGGVLHGAGIPGFAEGGIVPGPIGAPMLAIVHGGETVTPPGRAGATYNINVAVPVGANQAEVGRQLVAAIQEFERRSSKAWRS
jgi:hypothetical protein